MHAKRNDLDMDELKPLKTQNSNGKNHKNYQGNERKNNAIHQSKTGGKYEFEVYIYV